MAKKTNIYTSPRWMFWPICAFVLLLIVITCTCLAVVESVRGFFDEWSYDWEELSPGILKAIIWHRNGRPSSAGSEGET